MRVGATYQVHRYDRVPEKQRESDDPKTWKSCNRPLSPAEKQYVWRINEPTSREP